MPPIVDSIDLQEEEIKEEKKLTVILGCNNGFIFKFERAIDGKQWTMTGESKLEKTVSDVIQTDRERVIAVQDDGYFDYIATRKFHGVSHIRLSGFSKSSKTRLTGRGGHVAIADDNGLFFVK